MRRTQSMRALGYVAVALWLAGSARSAGAFVVSTLATGQSSPTGIAVDAISVYFTNAGNGVVAKVPVGGGQTVTIAAGQSGPTGIAVDATSVYWTNKTSGTVMKSALDGSGRVMLASGQGSPTGIAVDATSVYFTNESGKQVVKVPLGGGTVTVLASQQKGATGIAVDATYVYWTARSAGKVLRIPRAGGNTTTLASGQSSPSAIAVNGSNVFWTNEGNGTVMRAALDGSARTTIASGQGTPTGIALDGTSVYWTNQAGGTIRTTLLTGGVAVTVATAQSQPARVTARGTGVYWTNQSGGTVMKATAPARLFFNVVNAGGEELIYQDSFQQYVDGMLAQGITNLRVFGQWRERCLQCAPTVLDFNTEPSSGVYDFSQYFQRLDYAIVTKGMHIVLNFSFAGQLDTDPLTPGAQPAMPAFMGPSDVMQYRTTSGTDVMFSGTPPASGQTKVPRFEKASVRQTMLDFVTAVVTQFRARYGDAILYYAFNFNTTGENEYPLGAPNISFCDTSQDAKAAFQAWLPSRYATPQAVSTAWGHSPPFTSFGEIQILDGAGPPAIGQAPQAYLDFMAYREQALGKFLGEIRDRVHAAGGKAMAQYGSVWDAYSSIRGTFGFGQQIPGFDLVLIDDAPSYDHLFSMDYVRTNGGGIPFGNEADSVCDLACRTGDLACCCNAQTFPDNSCIDVAYGTSRMDSQVGQTYARGATFVDIANWDNFWQSAFPLFAAPIARAVQLGSEGLTTVAPSATQNISLRALYVHHEDWNYTNQLIAAHNSLGGATVPIAVVVTPDL